jgi:hypothetical protein
MRMPSWLNVAEQAAGVLLMAFVLLDVFLTVLYARLGPHGAARLGAGFVGLHVGRAVRAVLQAVPLEGKERGGLLSFCGPLTLVLLITCWAWGLTLGAALVVHPHLGDGIQVATGSTPTDFIAAIYAAGTSLAITGSSEFDPTSDAMRMLYLVNSLIGTSVVTLCVTYLLQVYAALLRRNALSLSLDLYTSETGDAAELIAALAPSGDWSLSINNLASLAQGITTLEESHHFYPLLFYFRPARPQQSIARFLLVALDMVTLLRTALAPHEAARAGSCAPVVQLDQACRLMAETLQATFMREPDPPPYEADAETLARWRARYRRARRRMRQAGLPLLEDAAAGEDRYIVLRCRWFRRIDDLARYMAFPIERVDPAGYAQIGA